MEKSTSGSIDVEMKEETEIEGKLNTAKQEVKQELNTAEGELNTAEGELNTAKQKLNTEEGKLNKAEEELETAEEELEKAKEANDPVRIKRAERQIKLAERATIDAAKAKGDAQTLIDSITSHIQFLTETINQLGMLEAKLSEVSQEMETKHFFTQYFAQSEATKASFQLLGGKCPTNAHFRENPLDQQHDTTPHHVLLAYHKR